MTTKFAMVTNREPVFIRSEDNIDSEIIGYIYSEYLKEV